MATTAGVTTFVVMLFSHPYFIKELDASTCLSAEFKDFVREMTSEDNHWFRRLVIFCFMYLYTNNILLSLVLMAILIAIQCELGEHII
jgi:hypothetical protein